MCVCDVLQLFLSSFFLCNHFDATEIEWASESEQRKSIWVGWFFCVLSRRVLCMLYNIVRWTQYVSFCFDGIGEKGRFGTHIW